MSFINDVNLENVGNYVGAVKEDNNLAKVKFIAKSKWTGGTNCKVNLSEYLVNGAVGSPEGRNFSLECSEPGALGGLDNAPNPVEYLATALCGCLNAAIATNSALFNNQLETLEIETAVDFDLMGILGLDRDVTLGATHVHYKVKIKGANKEATLKSKETIDKKSGIKNTMILPITVTTEVEYID
jgi:uncharacterized OsmC-like protein